ncbi:CpsD/CapB family tyrosine-protein kinase [Paenibacillus daejeonensis]|uniref:CpsD/CapB family tyrosine-protein kinase n=1 Tax=Paenibacillus daejeonensis TaxID=135193 RepID=UPI000360D4EE|nr:CpsD/CapB family tyrosine-protein kinase [Paenibacillus daejeonensis]
MSLSKPSLPLIAEVNPKSPISEAYKVLRTNVDFSNFEEDIQTVMITSSRMSEGKSTTTANLAVTYAQTGKRVLLIDADMRKPTQHKIFGLSNRYGLTSALSNNSELREVVMDTGIDHLSLLPSGPVPPHPSEMLASKRMELLLERARGEYDIVLIDTPPMMAVTDAQIMAAKCDGVILVIDAGKVKKDMARKVKAKLQHANARMLGVVLNNVNRSGSDSYAYYSYYGS